MTTFALSSKNLGLDSTALMGIVNLTPDSFSDGGKHNTLDKAVDHTDILLKDGAKIIDLGAESTRPGALAISPQEEQARLIPALEKLVKNYANTPPDSQPLWSIDTMHAQTAQIALKHGAHIINDVSGLNVEEEMIDLIADCDVPYVITHNRGNAQTMDDLTNYKEDELIETIINEINTIIGRFTDRSIAPSRLIIDPGFGFSKTAEQNWSLLEHLPSFISYYHNKGHKTLVGASRKRFLNIQKDSNEKLSLKDQDLMTALISAKAAEAGAWAVRVHNVSSSKLATNFANKLRFLS